MPVKNLLQRIHLLLILLLALSGLQINAAPVLAAPASAGLSVGSLLRPDGTLNIQGGANGSLALDGWKISLDPSRGPVFAPSGSGPSNVWNALSSTFDGTVKVITINGTDMYVGGSFSTISGCTGCSSIAKWNGTSWLPLGTGVSGEVSVITISGSDVYAGGGFASITGCTWCRYIAKWNGTSWSALGKGTSANVSAIAVNGTDVYAGGTFTMAGTSALNDCTDCAFISKWNGSAWSKLGQGIDAQAKAIAMVGNYLYVGGTFTQAGTSTAGDCTDCIHIARWDMQSSNWSALGKGISGGGTPYVYAIAVSAAGDVYAGGGFTSAGTSTADDCTDCIRIAKYSGGSWSALGKGVSSSVYAIAINGTDIYAGGGFTSAGTSSTGDCTNCKTIAKWNTLNSSWSALGTGTATSGNVFAVAISGTDVYAGGSFTSVPDCSTPANCSRIARYGAPSSPASPITVSGSGFADGGTLETGASTLTVQFSTDVVSDGSATAANNANNYLLLRPGANGTFDTPVTSAAICAAAHTPLGGDDESIPISSISYTAANKTATLTVSPAYAPLALGSYRLYVCGAASIRDLSGNAINGGANVSISFSVVTAGSTSTSTAKDPKTLPDTGFAPNRISSLPMQPASLAYTKMSGLWLEISSQKLQAEIVGVPEVNSNWDVSWLGNDAGWLNGTAFPTWNGNSVITAHVTDANGLPGPFVNLKDLAYGNKIVVHLYGEKYTYEVRASRMVFPDSTPYAFEHLQDHAYLTLITCQGYNFLTDSYMFRRVVRAVLVSVTAE